MITVVLPESPASLLQGVSICAQITDQSHRRSLDSCHMLSPLVVTFAEPSSPSVLCGEGWKCRSTTLWQSGTRKACRPLVPQRGGTMGWMCPFHFLRIDFLIRLDSIKEGWGKGHFSFSILRLVFVPLAYNSVISAKRRFLTSRAGRPLTVFRRQAPTPPLFCSPRSLVHPTFWWLPLPLVPQ